MYVDQKICIDKGSLPRVLASGVAAGALVGVLTALATYAIRAGNGGELNPMVVVYMAGMGLFNAAVNRFTVSRDKVFAFQQSADESTAIHVGLDWVVAIVVSALPVSLVLPDIAPILWRLPLSFCLVGAVLYGLWIVPYRMLVVPLSGLSQEERTLLMVRQALSDELGSLADGMRFRIDEGTLIMEGCLRSRDQVKEARLAVVGMPGIREIDSSGVKADRGLGL